MTKQALLLHTALLAGTAAAYAVSLTPLDGHIGMYNRPFPSKPNGVVAPVKIVVEGQGKVTLTATNIWGNAVDWQQDVELSGGKQTVEFAAPLGAYHIEAKQDGAVKATCDIGLIPPFHPGVRQDSFFASNTSSVRTGEELAFLESVGMKVQRTHFYGTSRKTFDEVKAHSSWVLPIVGYAIGEKSELAKKYKMHGPPADFDDFVSEWEKTLRQFPEITTYEFWNEPWIFGWTWADTPDQYRKLQVMWAKMALRVNPKMRIIAGNSWMFTQDHIQPYPDCYKGLLDGTTHHPYSGAGDPSSRTGNQFRSIDAGVLVNREMGLPYHYLTEGGTSYSSRWAGAKDNSGANCLINARKTVQYCVYSALSGCFQTDMQWDIGYGPGWNMDNTTLAVLTHFIEDRPVVADIWPENEMLTGAIFANPKYATDAVRKMPRAKDLMARWNVPIPAEYQNDTTKVAVIWSFTGKSNEQIDTTGTLTIADADGLKAYDMVCNEILPKKGTLVVPFTENPVYIVSDSLSVIELRKRIATARIDNVTPVNMYAASLLQPADRQQNLIVRMENQMNVAVSGTLTLHVPGQAETVAKFSIPAAKLADVAVPWHGVQPAENNRYGISLTAELKSGKRALGRVSHEQIIESAQFVKRTIALHGKLDDWKGMTPVYLVTTGVEDETKYLLNPNMKRPEKTEAQQATAKVYTAYDDQYVYIGLAGWGHKTDVGTEAKPGLPQYPKGEPTGLNYISLCGDVFQFAFGFRDRVPGHGRQANDPWAWKGFFYDTDYQYAAYADAKGTPRFTRLWGADTDRTTAFQIDKVPFVGPVDGAKIIITDEVYEIAIPRSELALFNANHDNLRFGFVLNGKFNWSDCAGVFDHWMTSGSFGPSWEPRRACQTFFGIGK